VRERFVKAVSALDAVAWMEPVVAPELLNSDSLGPVQSNVTSVLSGNVCTTCTIFGHGLTFSVWCSEWVPFESVEALRRAYQFTQLQDFLDIYYQGMAVLVTEQDFFDLAWAYLRRAQADNVRHVEMFFDPQGHTSRGVAFATVVDGLSRAIAEARRTLGISASLIMCFLRHLDEDDAQRTLDSALAHRQKIIGRA